jgi:hypothetical protein
VPVITPTIEDLRVPLPTDRTVQMVTWAGMVNGDSGAPLAIPEAADRSIQFIGTFDTSTIILEGSNDGTNYETLTDPQGNDISKSSADLEQVVEVTRYIRPRVTAGGGSTAITAILLVRR